MNDYTEVDLGAFGPNSLFYIPIDSLSNGNSHIYIN